MFLKKFRHCALRMAGALAMASVAATAQASLVTNGGFETGDFTGWTIAGTSFDGVDTLAPHTGAFAAFFGTPAGSTLSQTLATVAGGHYSIEFWLQVESNGGAAPNAVAVNWDGGPAEISLVDLPAAGYARYAFDAFASSATTSLSFRLADTPAFLDLDDVAVVSIPEPSSLALIAIAGLAGGLARRRPR